MKNILSVLSISLATIASNTCIAAASPRPDYVTEAQAIRDLMRAFERIPSIPGKPTPDTTFINTHGLKGAALSNYLFSHNIMYAYQSPRILQNVLGLGGIPITLRAWVGLQCVFPDVPKSQWAKDLGLMTNSPDATVSAGLVSKWIVDWAKKARGVVPGARGIPANSFALVKDFTGFYGTEVASPKDSLTESDMHWIGNNLYDMSLGYRLLSTRQLEILPILGLSYLNAAYKTDTYDMNRGFALIDKGITLTFQPNGEIVFHRPNVEGIDVSIGQGTPGTAVKAFSGWGSINFWIHNRNGSPQPYFRGQQSVVIHRPKVGTFEYASVGGFVTPKTWGNQTASYIGGIDTGAMVKYAFGKIISVNPYGHQFSVFGYPES